MNLSQTSLDRLTPPIQATVRDFAERVNTLLGQPSLGLSVFGAAAAGTIDLDRQTIRTVLIVQRVDIDLLRSLAAEGDRWGLRRVAAPLVMTPEYLQQSRDTFPLEFIEIQQQHITVWGSDHFAEITFERAHIRLQCERELKTLLLALHQGVLTAYEDRHLQMLSDDLLDRLVRTLRGVLWLHDKRQPLPATQVVPEIEKLLGRPLPGVRKALGSSDQDYWKQLRELDEEIQALEKFVDGL
jgi:hypothetical protein